MAAGASTATPPVLTPGSNDMSMQTWQSTVEGGTYQKQQFIPLIDEYGKKPYLTGNVRKWARVSGVALASTAVGTGLTYQDPKGTAVTFSPAGVYVAFAISANEDATAGDINFDSELVGEAEQALAEANDQTVLANVTSLTQFRGNANDDANAALIRNAIGLLGANTNGKAAPGKVPIYMLLDAGSQYGAVMSIPEFTNAQIRGDGENPQVAGIWKTGSGVTMALTTVLTSDGNGTHGVLWIPSAFVIGWNVGGRPAVRRQEVELQDRIILFNHFGSAVKHDLRAVDLRTNNTIPA